MAIAAGTMYRMFFIWDLYVDVPSAITEVITAAELPGITEKAPAQ